MRILILIKNFFIRAHFGQHGEDVIVQKLFDKSIKNGFYLDVGAHHPFRQSNTAYLWLKGWNGVNIDASKTSISAFNKIRKNDKNIWLAVVDINTAIRQTNITLNFNPNVKYDLGATCDDNLAIERKTSAKIKVPCDSLLNIINNYAPETDDEFHFMNIDIEGFDERCLIGIERWKSRPQVICIESLINEGIRSILKTKLNIILEQNGYELEGKTGISLIYRQNIRR